MKYLIVGRTGRGKDFLKELLQEMGWKFVLSCTTRKPRYEGENTHIFLSKEESASIPIEEKIALTFIKNGKDEPDEYFTTREQIEAADGYIVDPKGIETLLKNMPDENFEIIYIQALDAHKAREMSIRRANGDPDAAYIYDKRAAGEDKQFTEFERKLKEKAFVFHNCLKTTIVTNDYSKDHMRDIALILDEKRILNLS